MNYQTLKLPGNIIRFNHISREEGLSQSTVLSILQDRQGFMWFGLESGLNRFDGYNFISYKHDHENPNSLSCDQQVRALLEDHTGNIWIGTAEGLNKFEPTTETFTHYLKDTILSLYEDRQHSLWVGTGQGLYQFKPDTQTFTLYLSGDQVRAICEDEHGNLWIGTENAGLHKFDRTNGQVINTYTKETSGLSHNQLRALWLKDGLLWIGTRGGGLNKLDLTTEKFTSYFSDDAVIAIQEEGGLLWLGTFDKGLYVFDPQTETYTQYCNDPLSLNDKVVNSIYKDKSNLLWFGTQFNGISTLNFRAVRNFPCYGSLPHETNSLSNRVVQSLYEDRRGILWIGTPVGLDRLDRTTGEFTHYSHDPNDPTSLPSTRVIAIYEDSSGILWLGTDKGLVKFDRATSSFTAYSEDYISVIIEDRVGYLWIGADGLVKFDKATETFTSYPLEGENSNLISAIYQGQNGTIWVGTEGSGWHRLNLDGQTFTRYERESANENFIWSILEDSSGIIWLATSNGLNKSDPQGHVLKTYTTTNGLPDNKIYGILPDNAGNLWLSTNFGLSKFNPSAETFEKEPFKNYDERDGLQSNEFQTGAYHRSKNGELFFGGVNGFNAFYPANIKLNSHIPNVVLTKFQVLNQDRKLAQPLAYTTDINLTHKDLVFSFEFAVLDYTCLPKNQYQYQLEGFDTDWVKANSRRPVATYTNLDTGTYIFRVKGSNNDGLWNETGLTIKIDVAALRVDESPERKIDKLRRVVQEMAKSLTSNIRLSQEQILELTYRQAGQLVDTRNGYIVMFDPKERTLRIPLISKDGKIEQHDWPVEIVTDDLELLIEKLRQSETPPPVLNFETWYKEKPIKLQELPIPKSWLGVRLMIKDELLGNIGLKNGENDYPQDDKEMMEIMSDLAAIAIQNAQLVEKLEREVKESERLREFMEALQKENLPR